MGLALSPGWAGKCQLSHILVIPKWISPYQEDNGTPELSFLTSLTGEATGNTKLANRVRRQLEPLEPPGANSKPNSLSQENLDQSPLSNTINSLQGQSDQWTFAKGELSTTLESRQRWVSGPGTCAEPSHRCHDPSYTERPSRKTHGNRTERPHMSTPPVLLSLGVLSVGPSFAARHLISRTSKVLRGAKHKASP